MRANAPHASCFMQRRNGMKPQTELSAQELYQKKERFYPRNFISLMFEGFTFSFALAMFSPENVLPVYVASLSDKAIYIALISA